MKIEERIARVVTYALHKLYNYKASREEIQLQSTRKDFRGDITLVVFPLSKISKNNTVYTVNEIVLFLYQELEVINSFNVVIGFLNLEIRNGYWCHKLQEAWVDKLYGISASASDF